VVRILSSGVWVNGGRKMISNMLKCGVLLIILFFTPPEAYPFPSKDLPIA
jgi:hypothetical protein